MIYSAMALPDNTGKYAKEFHLDLSMAQKVDVLFAMVDQLSLTSVQLEPQITSSVTLNKQIKCNSKAFYNATFKCMIELIHKGKLHCKVLTTHRMDTV